MQCKWTTTHDHCATVNSRSWLVYIATACSEIFEPFRKSLSPQHACVPAFSSQPQPGLPTIPSNATLRLFWVHPLSPTNIASFERHPLGLLKPPNGMKPSYWLDHADHVSCSRGSFTFPFLPGSSLPVLADANLKRWIRFGWQIEMSCCLPRQFMETKTCLCMKASFAQIDQFYCELPWSPTNAQHARTDNTHPTFLSFHSHSKNAHPHF